jgi:hypothetical protein
MRPLKTGSQSLPVYQRNLAMNSPPYAPGAQSVWNRATNAALDAIASVVRRLGTMGHSDKLPGNSRCSRRMRSARAVQQIPLGDVRSHPDGVVSFATGFDEFERILDAHRRDRVSTQLPVCPSPKSDDAADDSVDVLTELTGVWFKQGQRHGDVDLSRGPKRGWFEMYAEKTG